MTKLIARIGMFTVAALAAATAAVAEQVPDIRSVGREGFASDAELQAAVGTRRYELECPANRTPDMFDRGTVFERGVRIYLSNGNNAYQSGRVVSGLLREGVKTVWQNCAMASKAGVRAATRTRYEVGFVDVFEPSPSGQPILVVHAEKLTSSGGFRTVVDLGAQRGAQAHAKALEEQRQQEVAQQAEADRQYAEAQQTARVEAQRQQALRAEEAARQRALADNALRQQQAAANAAQQAANAERESLRAAAQAEAQKAAVIRAEAGARWWGGFWTLVVLAGLGWLLVKFHQPLLRTIFLLAPTPADFDYDAALAQSRHLKGPAILVRARMYAQRIKLDAWKERMAAEREALSQAAARDAEFDRVRDERERARVHREPENMKKVVEAERLVVDDRVAAIKHRPVMNDAERRRQTALAEMNAAKAEQALERVENTDGEQTVDDSKAAHYEKRHKDLQANFDLRKRHIDEDHRLTVEERSEEHSKLKSWYTDQQQRLREGFNHP